MGGHHEAKTAADPSAAAQRSELAGPSSERPDRVGVTDRSVGRIGRAIRFVKERGLGEVLRLIRTHGLVNSLRFIGRNIRLVIAARADRKFDRLHAVDTAGTIPLDLLTITGPNRAHATEYISTSPKSFSWMMGHLGVDLKDYCFIDFGAGKGRTLLLASQWPLKAVMGVEFAKELAVAARKNITSYRGNIRCSQMEMAEGDATTFQFPDQPLVLYFYNPFGPEVMGSVLKNLVASLQAQPRDCWIVYATSYPETLIWARPLLNSTNGFDEIETRPMPFYLDAARSLQFAIFRRR